MTLLFRRFCLPTIGFALIRLQLLLKEQRQVEGGVGAIFLSEFNTKTEQTPECNDLLIITQAMINARSDNNR